METHNVTCKKCGLVDSFYVEEKANNKMAFCSRCKSFIKNLPYQEPKLYFGKYKGYLVSAIEDLNYLEWALKNIRLSQNIRDAVTERIHSLHELTR